MHTSSQEQCATSHGNHQSYHAVLHLLAGKPFGILAVWDPSLSFFSVFYPFSPNSVNPMVSFAQFLQNAGVHLEPGVFIAIIAGGLVFIVLLIVLVVYVHRRSKRKAKQGLFNKTALSFVDITYPHPPLPSRDSSFDPELQQEVVARETRQQEQTYMQLMVDLQRPTKSSRASAPPLPNQTPRQPPTHLSPTNATVRSPSEDLPVTAPTLLPIATPAVAHAKSRDLALKRGLSVRSQDSTVSEYSTASAPREFQERTYRPFNLTLETVPGSPASPTWPSTPGSYVWPKRARASLMREELAPETYAKVRWITNEGSTAQAVAPPVAHALAPAVGPVLSPSALSLKIDVPSPIHQRIVSEGPESAAVFYANESAASSSPVARNPAPPPVPF